MHLLHGVIASDMVRSLQDAVVCIQMQQLLTDCPRGNQDTAGCSYNADNRKTGIIWDTAASVPKPLEGMRQLRCLRCTETPVAHMLHALQVFIAGVQKPYLQPCSQQQQTASTYASARQLTVCHASRKHSKPDGAGHNAAHAARGPAPPNARKASQGVTKKKPQPLSTEQPQQPVAFAEPAEDEQWEQGQLHAAQKLHQQLYAQLGKPPWLPLGDSNMLQKLLADAAGAVESTALVYQSISIKTLVILLQDISGLCSITSTDITAAGHAELQQARSQLCTEVERLMSSVQGRPAADCLQQATCSQLVSIMMAMQQLHLHVELSTVELLGEIACVEHNSGAGSRQDRFLVTCSLPQLMVFTKQLTRLGEDLVLVTDDNLLVNVKAAIERMLAMQRGGLPSLSHEGSTLASDTTDLPELLTQLPWSRDEVQGSVLSADEMIQLAHLCLLMTGQVSTSDLLQQQWVVQLCYCTLGVKAGHRDAGALIAFCAALLEHDSDVPKQPKLRQALVSSMCEALMECGSSSEAKKQHSRHHAADNSKHHPAFMHPDFLQLLQLLTNPAASADGTCSLPTHFFAALVSHLNYLAVTDQNGKEVHALRKAVGAALIAASQRQPTYTTEAASALLMHWQEYGTLQHADVEELMQLPQLAATAGQTVGHAFQDRWEKQLIQRESREGALFKLHQTQLLQEVLLVLQETDQLPLSCQLVELCLPSIDELAQQLTPLQLTQLTVWLCQVPGISGSSASHCLMQALQAASTKWVIRRCDASVLPAVVQAAGMLASSGLAVPVTTSSQQVPSQDWAVLLSQLVPKYVSSWSPRQRCMVLHSAVVQLQADLPASCVQLLMQPLAESSFQDCSADDMLLILEASSMKPAIAAGAQNTVKQLLQHTAHMLTQPGTTFTQQFKALQLMAQQQQQIATVEDKVGVTVQAAAQTLLPVLLSSLPKQPDVAIAQQLLSVPTLLQRMGHIPDRNWLKKYEAASMPLLPLAACTVLVDALNALHRMGHSMSPSWLQRFVAAMQPLSAQLQPATSTLLLGTLHQLLVASRAASGYQAPFYTAAPGNLHQPAAAIVQLAHSLPLATVLNSALAAVPTSMLCNALAAVASMRADDADPLRTVLEDCTNYGSVAAQQQQQQAVRSHQLAAWLSSCCAALQQRQYQVAEEDLTRAAAALIVLHPQDHPSNVNHITALLTHLATRLSVDSSNAGSQFESNLGAGKLLSNCQMVLQACVTRKLEVPQTVLDAYWNVTQHADGIHLGHGILLLHQCRGLQVLPQDLQRVAETMAAEQELQELEAQLDVLSHLMRATWHPTYPHPQHVAAAADAASREAAAAILGAASLSAAAGMQAAQLTLQHVWQGKQAECAARASEVRATAAALEDYLASYIEPQSVIVSSNTAAAYVSAVVSLLGYRQRAAVLSTPVNMEMFMAAGMSSLAQLGAVMRSKLEIALKVAVNNIPAAVSSYRPQAAVKWLHVLWVAAMLRQEQQQKTGRKPTCFPWPIQQASDWQLLHPGLLTAETTHQPVATWVVLEQLMTVVAHHASLLPQDTIKIFNIDIGNPFSRLSSANVDLSHEWKCDLLRAAAQLAASDTSPILSERTAQGFLQLGVDASSKDLTSHSAQQLLLDTALVTCGLPREAEVATRLRNQLKNDQLGLLFAGLHQYVVGVRWSYKQDKAMVHRMLQVLDAACALLLHVFMHIGKDPILGTAFRASKQRELMQACFAALEDIPASYIQQHHCNPYHRYCTLVMLQVADLAIGPITFDHLSTNFYFSIAKGHQADLKYPALARVLVSVMVLKGTYHEDLLVKQTKFCALQLLQCMNALLRSSDQIANTAWLALELLYARHHRLPLDRAVGSAVQGNLHMRKHRSGGAWESAAELRDSSSYMLSEMTAILSSCATELSVYAGCLPTVWSLPASTVEPFIRHAIPQVAGALPAMQRYDDLELPLTRTRSVRLAYIDGGSSIGEKLCAVWHYSLLYSMALHTPGVDPELVQQCKSRFAASANAACNNLPPPPVEAVLTWTAPWLQPGLNDKPACIRQDMEPYIRSWLHAADWSSLVGPQPDPIQMLQLQTLCFTCPEFYQLMKSVQRSKGVVPVPGTHRYEWVYAQTMEAMGIIKRCMPLIMPPEEYAASWSVAERVAAALQLQVVALQQDTTLLECDELQLLQLCKAAQARVGSAPFQLTYKDTVTLHKMRNS